MGSTALAPPPRHLGPGPLAARWVGLAYGVALAPGASQIGAAFVVLRWLGVSGWRAAEMAMMVSIPVMGLHAARVMLGGASLEDVTAGQLALAVLLAFVTASLAASWWKVLCERSRTMVLTLWLVPLSLALLAYGRALPHPVDRMPEPPSASASR